MLLQFCALGVTMSWDDGFLGARASRSHNDGFPGARASRPHNDGFPGARASRPHQTWHSLGHLPHMDQPGTAPWLSFGLAAAVPADRVAACSIALKLSGGQRDSMRAGRPRSQGNHSPLEGESQKPSRQAKADAVGGWRVTSQKADLHPLGNSRLPASPAPAPQDGADHSRVKQVLFQADKPGRAQHGLYPDAFPMGVIRYLRQTAFHDIYSDPVRNAGLWSRSPLPPHCWQGASLAARKRSASRSRR